MHLPGRLHETTLGDLLGQLHRERATGTLELIERDGPHAGKAHAIELIDGRVSAVSSPHEVPPLGALLGLGIQARRGRGNDYVRIGEFLLDAGLVTREALQGGLRRQFLFRLDAAFSLVDANIRFRPPRPRSSDHTNPEPIAASEFLPGRPRARSRSETSSKDRSSRDPRRDAFRVLGLSPGATAEDIQRAFRTLARATHPDAHPSADGRERSRLLGRFAELSRAYHLLTG